MLTPNRFHEAIVACEQYAKSLSRRELTLFLAALLLFFQDACHRRINPSVADLNNPDLSDNVNRFAKNFPDTNYFALSQAIEDAISSLERNVAPLLVMATLTTELRQQLQRRG